MKTHHVLGSLVLAGMLAGQFGTKLQAQTQTYDRKVYSATMCQVTPDWNEGAGAINTTPFLTGAEQVASAAPPVSVVLVCPIVRDYISSSSGVVISVFVNDSDPVHSVSCSAISASPYQNQWTQTAVVQTGGTFAGGNTTLNLPFLTPLYANGPINVICTLTGQSTTMYGYIVREPLPTDGEP